MLFTLVHWIIGFISTQEYFNIFFLKVYLEYVKLWTQMKSCFSDKKVENKSLCKEHKQKRKKKSRNSFSIYFLSSIYSFAWSFCVAFCVPSLYCTFPESDITMIATTYESWTLIGWEWLNTELWLVNSLQYLPESPHWLLPPLFLFLALCHDVFSGPGSDQQSANNNIVKL